MVKPAAHDSLDVCSTQSSLKIRMLELVDRIILRFIDANRKRSSRFSDIRDFSLNGKTTILHIVILGSIPRNSKGGYSMCK